MILVGASALANGEAHCQIRVEYSGVLNDDETPPVFTNSSNCDGTCTGSGDCKKKDIDPDANVTRFRCQCPSGGGHSGCHGEHVGTNLQGVWTWTLECVDGCNSGYYCDWADHSQGGPQKFARCKCNS